MPATAPSRPHHSGPPRHHESRTVQQMNDPHALGVLSVGALSTLGRTCQLKSHPAPRRRIEVGAAERYKPYSVRKDEVAICPIACSRIEVPRPVSHPYLVDVRPICLSSGSRSSPEA